MPAVDVSSIKEAIVLARELATARELRDFSVTTGGQLPARSLPGAYHDASRQLAAAVEKSCGLDREAFESLRAQKGAELVRAHEAAHADAVKRSGETKQQLRRQIEARRGTLEGFLAAPEPEPVFHAIEAPFLIWATPPSLLSDSQIIPWNSSAKFRYQASGSAAGGGRGNVTFYYLWQNEDDRYAVVDVDGYLILNGFGRVFQTGGWTSGERSTSLTIAGVMSLWEWWNQPPTSPALQPDQSQTALSLWASPSGWFADDQTVSGSIFRGYDLRNTLSVVPPQGVLVIEVEVDFNHFSAWEGDYQVTVDFESGDFEVGSPFVLIGVVS
jgi:hypothetical protein